MNFLCNLRSYQKETSRESSRWCFFHSCYRREESKCSYNQLVTSPTKQEILILKERWVVYAGKCRDDYIRSHARSFDFAQYEQKKCFFLALEFIRVYPRVYLHGSSAGGMLAHWLFLVYSLCELTCFSVGVRGWCKIGKRSTLFQP